MKTQDWKKIERDINMMRDIWTQKKNKALQQEDAIGAEYALGVMHGYEVVLRMIADLKINKYPGVPKSSEK